VVLHKNKGILFTDGSGVVGQTLQGAAIQSFTVTAQVSQPSQLSLSQLISPAFSQLLMVVPWHSYTNCWSNRLRNWHCLCFNIAGSTGQALVSGAGTTPTWTAGTLTLASEFRNRRNQWHYLNHNWSHQCNVPSGVLRLQTLEVPNLTGAKTFDDLTIMTHLYRSPKDQPA